MSEVFMGLAGIAIGLILVGSVLYWLEGRGIRRAAERREQAKRRGYQPRKPTDPLGVLPAHTPINLDKRHEQ